ncbi:MAG: hypothetical protein J3R72DRAFT_352677, partial [Linnemannia gamsii]
SSTSSDLEMSSHNPTDDSLGPLPAQAGPFTDYPNEWFLSSCSLLVEERTNAYRILLQYDKNSRHRRIKKQ